MISARETCFSDKRNIIDENSLISTVEKLNDVREAKPITRERGAKRQKVFKKHGFKARRESSDKSEVELNDNNDDMIEILDCIEVEL